MEDEPSDGMLSRTDSAKAVIMEEPEDMSSGTSPRFEPRQAPESPISPKRHRASLGSKRLSGRPSSKASNASCHSATSHDSGTDTAPAEMRQTSGVTSAPAKHSHHVHHHHHHANHILSQVKEWLHQEKARKSKHKSRTPGGPGNKASATGLVKSAVEHGTHRRRRSSESSDGAQALEQLEKILGTKLELDTDGEPTAASHKVSMASRKGSVGIAPPPDEDGDSPVSPRKTSVASKRGSIKRLLRKKSTVSSDTDCQDYEKRVPSVEVTLDNTKTMSYTGGAASSQVSLLGSGRKAKEADCWSKFKNEIVRLTHTLRLKGWRQVPLEGADIGVERLSGALTNAVYVVSPPKELLQNPPNTDGSTRSMTTGRQPAKLLLRIYGPQVEHLIDREKELQILKRLARKNIGPRLLGTFTNGRFEEFFHAKTLTARDLRIPDTSKQIAKRMRELHEGIELLKEEREAGPFMWQNWDKWVCRCEEITMWIDKQVLAGNPPYSRDKSGLVCGVEWPVFRKAVERIEPEGKSPLLLPANEHKQLIVIDFEYASANSPGLEFANHF
ncbi:MAG: hypothetical protein Q9174_006263, partial [Haloplaca sp. 1 TL-2023]